MIIARSDYPIADDLCDKIALFCDVDKKAVVPMTTTKVLYEVPLLLEKAGIGEYVVEKLGLTSRQKPDWRTWEKLVCGSKKIKTRNKNRAGWEVCGTCTMPTCRSGNRSNTPPWHQELRSKFFGFTPPTWKRGKAGIVLEQAHGIIVPGGFGSRGTEGKIIAAKFARENKIPYLGLVPGDATDVHRICQKRPGAGRCQFDRV